MCRLAMRINYCIYLCTYTVRIYGYFIYYCWYIHIYVYSLFDDLFWRKQNGTAKEAFNQFRCTYLYMLYYTLKALYISNFLCLYTLSTYQSSLSYSTKKRVDLLYLQITYLPSNYYQITINVADSVELTLS